MDDWGRTIEPRPAFRRDRDRLLDLLGRLTPADWHRPTVCGPWLVRDVVAHMLGNDLGRLSRSRDDHPGPDVPEGAESVAGLVARLNDRWVTACAGLSPAVICEQLACTTPAVLAFWDRSDLSGPGEPVTWAGPRPAPRWLDCARDFTEYWTHQRQVREALGAPRVEDVDTDHVAIDTFLRAVPHTLRDVGDEGATVSITVVGRSGGTWSWTCGDGRWSALVGDPDEPTTRVTIAEDVLWRLCTRGIGPSEALPTTTVRGRSEIGRAVAGIVSIIHQDVR